MVAAERRGRGNGSFGIGPARAAIFLSTPSTPTPKQVITQLILSQRGKIWQLSEFYMKILPLLTIFCITASISRERRVIKMEC